MAGGLGERLKQEGRRLGFDLIGVAPAVAPPGYPSFLSWLEAGHAAGMDYLHRACSLRSHPGRLLEGVRSVVMAGIVYGRPAEREPGPTEGKVARYARGQDYHPLLWRGLESLLDWIRREIPDAQGRAIADSAPLLERDFARLAGLGWIAKNSMLIHPRAGSFTVLGALLLDVEIEPDRPFELDHCGTCTRCLDACPTGAFVGPGQLDARKCISYWTIEHKGPIPDPIAEDLDGWVFGCDVCQDVCPWNRKAPAGRRPELQPAQDLDPPDLLRWLTLSPEEFRARFKPTALWRTRRPGLIRNAALVLGSNRVEEAVPALVGLLEDPDEGIRAAATWALARIDSEEARRALDGRAGAVTTPLNLPFIEPTISAAKGE